MRRVRFAIMFGVCIAASQTARAQPNPAGFVRGHIFVSSVEACSPDATQSSLFEIDPDTHETRVWHTQDSGLRCPRGLRFSPNSQSLRVLDFGSSSITDMDDLG